MQHVAWLTGTRSPSQANFVALGPRKDPDGDDDGDDCDGDDGRLRQLRPSKEATWSLTIGGIC